MVITASAGSSKVAKVDERTNSTPRMKVALRIAREDGGDAAITGQRHVDHEIVPRNGRDLTEFPVQRVLGKRALHRLVGLS